MLKKRILASSLASVMALSSVSVVAFADETATAEYGEVVTRPELKEFLKTYDNLIKGDINNYGSVQALRFQEAYDHAAYVAADAEADEASITAAYQMVKAVYATLQQYTNEQLKELVEELKPIYDGNNILNEEIMDNIYDEAAYLEFKNAYGEAESTVDVDDLMMVTDAYINLSDAATKLEDKRLTPVTKSEYRALFREYEAMLSQFSKNETWRRGTVGVNPVTGKKNDDDAKDNDLTKAAYVTWGELQTIVTGASNISVTKAVVEIDRTNKKPGADTDLTRVGTWIAPGKSGTVEDSFYDMSKAFDDFKSASKTTDSKIKGAYDAAKEAIAVFKSWKAIDPDSTQKSASFNTLNGYRTKLVNDFESGLAATLESESVAGLFWTDGEGNKHKALKYDAAKGTLVGQEGAAKNNCVLRIDSGTGLIQLEKVVGATGYEDAAYVPTEIEGRKSYTIKISEGVDYLQYIPVRAANVKTNTTLTANVDDKIAAVKNALTMLETYTVEANKGTAATDESKKAAYGADGGALDVFDLDENKTVTKPALSAREYTFINRYLTYALQDLYPVIEDPCSHTRAEIKALIAKAYDLIDETGSCNIFAEANDNLANARKEAVEWVRESEKDKLYKDNNDDHGVFELGDEGGKKATYVYHTLSCKGETAQLNDTYDKLSDLLAKYPISYGEIVGKIANVNEAVEEGIYGTTVKEAVDKVAYCLSVLKASDIGNEAFTDERALNSYNRLRSDVKSADIDATEKALVAALEALDKAIEEAEKEPEKPAATGDLDGDGKVLPGDAKAALELFLNEKYDAAADMDGNGVITPADARAILEIFLKG